MRKLLFLCTGNYYRSRYAEAIFNHWAHVAGVDWIAESRGLQADKARHMLGPVSGLAKAALRTKGLKPREGGPLQVTAADLDGADLIIALDEEEHRGVMDAEYPHWADEVEYWHVHDVDQTAAEEALPTLDRMVERLLERLIAAGEPSREASA